MKIGQRFTYGRHELEYLASEYMGDRASATNGPLWWVRVRHIDSNSLGTVFAPSLESLEVAS